MLCPDCETRARGNFCSRCGRRLPYVVGRGSSFIYGLRFPAPARKGNGYRAAVNLAREAPRYWEREISGTLYHSALYDLETVRQLATLFHAARKVFIGREELIEHTIDGRRFSSGWLPWVCFANKIANMPPGGIIVPP